jgi:hypothetical protein
MGYTTRPGTEIVDYWPDNTDTELYIVSNSGYSLAAILDIAKEKWPDVSLENITIESEKIHTNCVYYDLYDPCDYTDFIILTYNP